MLRLALIVMAVVLVAVSPASATLLFDDISRANSSPPRDLERGSPLAAITVSVLTSINQIGARMDLNSSGNLKFLIFDLNSHGLLFGTGPTAYADDGLTFKVSPVFSDFVLTPGIVYGIGAIADVAGNWSVRRCPQERQREQLRLAGALGRRPGHGPRAAIWRGPDPGRAGAGDLGPARGGFRVADGCRSPPRRSPRAATSLSQGRPGELRPD